VEAVFQIRMRFYADPDRALKINAELASSDDLRADLMWIQIRSKAPPKQTYGA
jgi:hypothetical protein